MTLVAEGVFTLVGEGASSDEAQRLCAQFKLDVLLLDVHMPVPPAVETVRHPRAQCAEIKVLILTGYDSEAYVRSLISAEAVAYVLKEEATHVVVRALRTVLQADTWFSRAIVEEMAHLGIGEQPASDSLKLKERETRVLHLVVAGQTDRQIGVALGLAERTVRHHLESIYSKLGVNTFVEAVVRTVGMGLVGQ